MVHIDRNKNQRCLNMADISLTIPCSDVNMVKLGLLSLHIGLGADSDSLHNQLSANKCRKQGKTSPLSLNGSIGPPGISDLTNPIATLYVVPRQHVHQPLYTGTVGKEMKLLPILTPVKSSSNDYQDLEKWDPNFTSSSCINKSCKSESQNFLKEHVPCSKTTVFHLRHSVIRSINLNMDYAGTLVNALMSSTTFCKSFLQYARTMFQKEKINHNGICSEELILYTPVGLLIIIYLDSDGKQWIDYKWSSRVCNWINKRMLLDDAMNWLNTLGGGYSALGDHFVHHAEEAGKISGWQLKLALEMGDPPTVIRCKLYFALSLMQRGYLRQSKVVIRSQYAEAKVVAGSDHRLLAMCKGIWARLSYYYSKRREERTARQHGYC